MHPHSESMASAGSRAVDATQVAADLLRNDPPRPTIALSCPDDLPAPGADEPPDALQPAIDLNGVTPNGIAKCGEELVFRGPKGVRRFALGSSRWSHIVSLVTEDRPHPPGKRTQVPSSLPVEVPRWWPFAESGEVYAVDNTADPRWILVGDAVDTVYHEHLFSLERKGTYKLPRFDYTSVQVLGTTAWLASPTRVSKLDLKTFDLTDLITLPVVADAVGIVEDGRTVYVASTETGLQAIDQDTGNVRVIESVNLSGGQIVDLAQLGREIYVLISDPRRYQSSLGIHNLDDGTSEVMETRVQHAQKLVVGRDSVSGYGYSYEDSEDEEGVPDGGAFMYIRATKTLRTISADPVLYLSDSGKYALGVDDKGETIRLHRDGAGNLQADAPGKSDAATAEIERLRKESNDRAATRKAELEKRIRDVLSQLKVRYRTIEIKRGAVEVKGFR